MDIKNWQVHWHVHTERILIAVRLIVILPAFALPVFWWSSYSGPYRWLVEFQQDLMQAYYPIATVAATFASSIGPAFAGLWLLGCFFQDEQRTAIEGCRIAVQEDDRITVAPNASA